MIGMIESIIKRVYLKTRRARRAAAFGYFVADLGSSIVGGFAFQSVEGSRRTAGSTTWGFAVSPTSAGNDVLSAQQSMPCHEAGSALRVGLPETSRCKIQQRPYDWGGLLFAAHCLPPTAFLYRIP